MGALWRFWNSGANRTEGGAYMATEPLGPQAEAESGHPAEWVNRDGLTAGVGKRRILLTVSYDGTAYAGWQRQLNAMTVQQRLEEALRKLTGEMVSFMGASRPDAGVHALGQRAHFDTDCHIPADRFPNAMNTCLPSDIRVLWRALYRGSMKAKDAGKLNLDAVATQTLASLPRAPAK